MSRTLALLIALAFLAPLAQASQNDLAPEVGEPREERAADGQWNGLDTVPRDAPRLVLDSVYLPAAQDANVARRTGGPDVILPGLGAFAAWHGWWQDLNGNGRVDVVATGCPAACVGGAGNEYAASPTDASVVGSLPGVRLVGFVDPGSHPNLESHAQPTDAQPEVQYIHRFGAPFATGRNLDGLYFDGSLLQTYVVKSVANGILVGDPEERFLCLREKGCMVDVDRYAAVLWPVATPYAATLAPLVNAVPAPNLGLARAIQPPPPAAPVTGLVRAAIQPEYPLEYLEPGSSAFDLGIDAYREAYHGWVDLKGSWAVPSIVASFPGAVGVGAGAEAGAFPGFWGYTLNTGIWKDLNGDGVIGVARNPNDVYDGGNVQDPNDYGDPTGEWKGWHPPGDCTDDENRWATAILRPESPAGWGQAGVVVTDSALFRPQTWTIVTGHDSIVMKARCYAPDPSLGLWFSRSVLLFPHGNVGIPFSVQLAPITIAFSADAIALEEVVFDADGIAPFEPRFD